MNPPSPRCGRGARVSIAAVGGERGDIRRPARPAVPPHRGRPAEDRDDLAGALELDSASFNHYFFDILVELHPATRFVYTRRNAVSWADSFLIMVLRHGTYRRGRP
jgi:hypothetical protein